MVQSFVIGMDGGQTSTIAAVADLGGNILGVGRGGPANHIKEPGGVERLRRTLESCRVQLGLGDFPGNIEPLEAGYFAMTGASDAVGALVREVFNAKRLVVEGDIWAACTGASLDDPSIVVLAGTGTVARGLDKDGQELIIGGWGYLGDEAGGYDIGRRAAIACCRARDGRGEKTILEELILEATGTKSIRDFLWRIYSGAIARHELSRLSNLVARAAREGDLVAQELLIEAGEDLAAYALAVQRKLGIESFQNGAVLPIFYTGGVFKAGPWLVDSFVRAIRHEFPKAEISPAIFPPVIGAVIRALRLAGVAITSDVIEALRQSASIINIEKIQEGMTKSEQS
ncbi:MAG: hypothetical protein HPY52_08130 [Firmicutes bacterium]|nr:hypothetical protein [Bacillota bacterium]